MFPSLNHDSGRLNKRARIGVYAFPAKERTGGILKLTISGKEYETPEFSAADFDDWRPEIEIVNNASKDKTYIEVQTASIKVIVGFVKANFPELQDDRAIKAAIPSRSVIPPLASCCTGKKTSFHRNSLTC
jgi:hypothetical protein